MTNYHIDLSRKFWERKTTGIACICVETKRHVGCALDFHLKKRIHYKLIINKSRQEYAMLHAICIYYLIRSLLKEINCLIICNDEDFKFVKKYLLILIKEYPLEIVNLFDFKRSLKRNIQSPADNYARHYAKRGLKRKRLGIGMPLNVIEITYSMIEEKWMKLKDCE